MASPGGRTGGGWFFALFLLFLLGYNLFRVGLFVMTQNGSVKPDHPLDPIVNVIVVYSELAIGIVGLLALPGLLWSKPWGFWITLAINGYAIAFDAVSAVLVQASAAGGVIPPVIILVGLVVLRHRFFPGEAEPARGPLPDA